MRIPALLALAIPLLMSSCAALNGVLSNDPVVDSAGPLNVGKTYSVSGVIDGRTVSVGVPVTTLVTVTNGRGTVSDRDTLAALDAGKAGFVSASFLTSPVDSLNIVWTGDLVGGVTPRYTCVVSTLLSMPYTGVLTLVRGGNTYKGTCSVSSS